MDQNDDFNAYRAMCANRLRRLERYKKARSFCSLEDDQPSTASTMPNRLSEQPPASAPAFGEEERFFEGANKENNSAFEMIREKMFSLMENDVTLLQQLLSLGDQISEMKEKRMRGRSLSTSSIDRQTEQDEMEDQFSDETPFSSSTSAVTNLFVNDCQPQYFSRQNSVLRIPIPPRSSNRFGNNRAIRRPSDTLRAPARNLRIQSDDSASESSEGAISPLSHTPSTVSSKSSMTYSSSCASEVAVHLTGKSRSSNSSIDSGIRESSDTSASPSPTFERII